jgi:hypothetical protein
MAAPLGFKDFTTGEVLTAADVDGYLMQGIWVFANATARDAAVTSPQEGNFAFLKDTNVTTYYTGSAWANLDTTGMTNPMTTTGDMVYSSSGSTPARLGIGSTGNVLTVSGGLPVWSAPGGGFVSAGVYVGTGQSTTSTSFTDLATVQSVTLTTGTKAMITVTCWADNNTVNNRCNISVAVSGATTLAAGADNSIVWRQRSTANTLEFMSGTFYLSGLTAGSNTFTMKFMSPDNTTATFYYRHFIAIDMGS